MPTAEIASSASSAHTSSIFFCRPRSLCLPATTLPRSFLPPKPPPPPPPAAGVRRSLSCKATLAADVSHSSSPEAVILKEIEASGKIGARIRVKAPIKIFHVAKAPALDLCGMEGVIKNHVGLYNGKRVSASLPFKIEFLLPAERNEKPIKFFAHLREGEFEQEERALLRSTRGEEDKEGEAEKKKKKLAAKKNLYQWPPTF